MELVILLTIISPFAVARFAFPKETPAQPQFHPYLSITDRNARS